MSIDWVIRNLQSINKEINQEIGEGSNYSLSWLWYEQAPDIVLSSLFRPG